jgi:hypothetical protein
MRRAASAVIIGGGLAVALAAGGGLTASLGGQQATASCAIEGWPVHVDVTFSNPTGRAVQPSSVAVVGFDATGAEDWSDSDWHPDGNPFTGYVIAAGQQVTYQGSIASMPPADAVSCAVTSWQEG